MITELYMNGQKKQEIHYKDGKKYKWTSWAENGLRKTEMPPSNTPGYVYFRTTTEWYKNGQKQSERNYIDGQKHGTSTYWDKNGQKMAEANYVKGNLHWTTTSWYENEQKKEENNYKGGEVLSQKEWDENGTLIKDQTY